MKRDWWYVVIMLKNGSMWITVSDDPDLDWDTVVAEFASYHDARDWCYWFAAMRDA